jgi:predicted PolB exonuclease-like 3'-5' exonuclease
MNYPKEFFDINLRFAQKVSEISQETADSALLHYTNLYIRFGIGRDFDATNPIWQEYLEGFHQAQDVTEWTYRFYLR